MVRTYFAYTANAYNTYLLGEHAWDDTVTHNWKRITQTALDQDARRSELVATMREHPEWHLGTSTDVDTILRPAWEGGNSTAWTINRERQMVVQPWFWIDDTWKVLPPEDLTVTTQVDLIWVPDDDAADIQGHVAFESIHYH